jgi:hypothetical protein
MNLQGQVSKGAASFAAKSSQCKKEKTKVCQHLRDKVRYIITLAVNIL